MNASFGIQKKKPWKTFLLYFKHSLYLFDLNVQQYQTLRWRKWICSILSGSSSLHYSSDQIQVSLLIVIFFCAD